MPRWAIIVMILAGAAVPFSYWLLPAFFAFPFLFVVPTPPQAELQYLLEDRESWELIREYDSSGIIGNASWDSASRICTLQGQYRFQDNQNLVVAREVTLRVAYSGPFGSNVNKHGEVGTFVKVVNNGTIVIDRGSEISFLGELDDLGRVYVENDAVFVNEEGSRIYTEDRTAGAGEIVVSEGGRFDNKGVVERAVRIVGD